MARGVNREEIKMTPSNIPGLRIGVGENNAQLYFTGTELYRFEISNGVMQNFATFEWLLWQQKSIWGKFK